MELDKINKLLEAYFEGSTSLEDETILMDYFNNHKVADHLLQYKPIFVGLSAARNESSSKDFKLEKSASKFIKPWWYAVAGMVVLAVGIGSLFLSRPQLSQEEKEALIAFEKSKKALMMLSENLNKGTQQLSFVNQFSETKEMFWKETSE